MCLDYLRAESERQFGTPAQHVGSHFLPSRFQSNLPRGFQSQSRAGSSASCWSLAFPHLANRFAKSQSSKSIYATTVPADVIKQRARLRDAWFANRPPTGSTALEAPVQSATATPILDLPLFPRRLRTLAPPFNPAIGIRDCRENSCGMR